MPHAQGSRLERVQGRRAARSGLTAGWGDSSDGSSLSLADRSRSAAPHLRLRLAGGVARGGGDEEAQTPRVEEVPLDDIAASSFSGTARRAKSWAAAPAKSRRRGGRMRSVSVAAPPLPPPATPPVPTGGVGGLGAAVAGAARRRSLTVGAEGAGGGMEATRHGEDAGACSAGADPASAPAAPPEARRAHFALTHPLSSPLSSALTPRGGHAEVCDGMPPDLLDALKRRLDLSKLAHFSEC